MSTSNDLKHIFLPCPSMLFVVALFLGTFLSTYGSDVNHEETNLLLEKSISSMERMVKFFKQDYASVNVDGLFGIRTGQGSMNQSVLECIGSRYHCPVGLVQKLKHLNDEINNIVTHAVPYVEAQDPVYYQHFLPLLDGPYILHYKTEIIEEQNILEPDGDRTYDEETGDKCFSLLIGSYENESKCSVPDDCWNFMTKGNEHGYVSTHQLLFFIIADKNGCLPALESRIQSLGERSVRAHETMLCGHILADAKRSENNGNVKILQQDLFLEQSLLCSLIGYQNFIKPDWVRMVLSWQNDAGCFTLLPTLSSVESEIVQLRGEKRKLLRLMQQEARNIETLPPVTGRKLLREKIMKGDCLSHKTGLAFGVVGAYIRHFVRQLYGPPDLSQ